MEDGPSGTSLLKLLRVSEVLLLGVLVGAMPLHLLSQTALPLKSPTGAFIAPLRKRGPTPNPAGNEYGKLEFIFFFLNIGILLICIAGTHFRMLLSKNLPLH